MDFCACPHLSFSPGGLALTERGWGAVFSRQEPPQGNNHAHRQLRRSEAVFPPARPPCGSPVGPVGRV